jgi:hypothetical protein
MEGNAGTPTDSNTPEQARDAVERRDFLLLINAANAAAHAGHLLAHAGLVCRELGILAIPSHVTGELAASAELVAAQVMEAITARFGQEALGGLVVAEQEPSRIVLR